MIFKKIAGLLDRLPTRMQRYLRFIAGWLSIGLGLIGIVLPLLPGIPLLLLGSWLLGWDEWLRPWLAKFYAFVRRVTLGVTGTRGEA